VKEEESAKVELNKRNKVQMKEKAEKEWIIFDPLGRGTERRRFELEMLKMKYTIYCY